MEHIQELIQKNKSRAIDLSEASDIMPKDLKEHQIRIYNAVLDSEYLSNEYLKDLIDAVIEDEEKEIQPFKVSENSESIVAWNNAKKNTINRLQAIKKLL